ncbi:MAG: DUF5106 domain-containing protein [Bacteroidetes bacterium]|nr:DUF5106 domain-containing protein [Bacteroidota bacterium]
MKYAIAILGFLFSTVHVFAQHNLEFNVKGLNRGDQCILAHYYADQNKIVDTSEATATGKVVFKGKDKLLNGVYILVLPKHTYLEFVVPNGDQDFVINFDTTLNPLAVTASGSEDNEAFFEFNHFTATKGTVMKDLRKKYDETSDEKEKENLKKQMTNIDKEVDKKRRDIISQHPLTFTAKLFRTVLDIEFPDNIKNDTTGKKFDYYREHYWDHYDLTDDGILRTPVYKNKLEYYFTKLFVQTPDSIIPAIDDMANMLEKNGASELYKYTVWWCTNHYEDSKLMCMDKVLHHMAKNYYCAGRCFWADSALVAKMCEHAAKIGPTLCGEIAPDMVLEDTTFIRRYQLHKITAPVTIVVFWDHQCGHCKKEIPVLKQMYDSLKGRGVEVYAVYTQGDWKGWKKYIIDNKLNWINVMDATNSATFRKDYNIFSTPQVLLLDENKKILYKNPPAENVGIIADIMLKEYEEKHSAPK